MIRLEVLFVSPLHQFESPGLFSLQGDKNAGYDVLYHNMKYGSNASKELADFIRDR